MSVRRFAQRLTDALNSGPNRIALSTALRGTLATALPLAVLPHIGLAGLTYPAVLGALGTSMVDVGGPYRTRLIAMLVQAVGGPALLLLGSLSAGHWWAAAPVMAAIGTLSGLIRAVGPGGASLGPNAAVAFLVGLQIGARHATWALGYGCGGLWTVLVTLSFWQLRPYRRLEQEVASVWETVAALFTAVASTADASAVSRRRREQRIAAAHATARATLERAREALGEMRVGMLGPGTTLAQLMVLLDCAASLIGSAVTLCELPPLRQTEERTAETELAGACRAVARALLNGNAEPLQSLPRFQAPRSGHAELEEPGELVAWIQAMRSLQNAHEAVRLLFGTRSRLPDLLRVPFVNRLPRGAVIEALRTHATTRSAIFRHAMRVAAVTTFDTIILTVFRLPHGIWLPLTSLVILQPDYGGTLARATQRSFGTLAGAVIASVLLATVHGTAGYDAALGVLLFATFLLIRRNYGYGITFLTPIIILLIGMSSADPWIDLAERVAYTIAGALLALAAGYLLWPQWERDKLRDRLAEAIRADEVYIDAVLRALCGSAPRAENLGVLRRQAEMAIANADAGFQRMLAEPAHGTALLGVSFALLVYLHRLCRHAIALSAPPRGASIPQEPLAQLQRLMTNVMQDVGRVIGEGRTPVAWPSIEAQLAEVASQLAASPSKPARSSVATLLSRLIDDLTGLLSAAGYAKAA